MADRVWTLPEGEEVARWEPAAGGIAGDVLSATVAVSSAEILALFSDPVTVAPALGAGKAYMPLFAFGVYSAGGTSYDIESSNIVLTNDIADNFAFALQNVYDVLNNSTDEVDFTADILQAGSGSVPTVNQPLVMWADTTDPVDGDGSLVLTVFYVVLDLS